MANPFQNRIMPHLRNNSDAYLRLSAGLLGGQNAQQQLAGGIAGFADARASAKEKQIEQAKQNRTIEWLRQVSPELAQAVEMGALSPSDAYKQHLTAQTAGKNPYINAGDGQLFNWQDKSWVTAPGGGQAKPLSTLGKLKSDYDAGYMDEETYRAAVAKAAQSEGMEMVSDGQGGFIFRQGTGIGSNPGKMTETQSKANIYASRMEAAEKTLQALETQGTNLGQSLWSGVPVVGNYKLMPEYRQYEQAQRDFLNAVLRQESGAVIAESEFENGRRQYFPVPGDDPATIEQKRQNRLTAIKTIREASNRPATSQDNAISTDDDINALIDQYAD